MIDFNNNIYLGVASPDMERDLSNYYTKAQTRALVDTKQDVITGAATTITSDNLTANRAVVSNSSGKVTVSGTTSTELGYVHGVTSAIQAQLNAKASTSLDNLSSAGQMVIDSQNGTISNCILEIPQNIKLEDNGSGTITLKSGSVITLGGSTYTTLTTSSDSVFSETGGYVDRDYVLFYNSRNGQLERQDITEIVSGNTDSLSGVKTHVWFDTTNKVINHYSDTSTTQDKTYPYPIAVISKNGGSFYSIKKDSNGNDMIFNGACFVGHHAVVYPNVKGLAPNQKNADGSLKSYFFNHQSLEIVEIQTNIRVLGNNGSTINGWSYYSETDDINNVTFRGGERIYDRSTNTLYTFNSSTVRAAMPVIFCGYNGTTITDFTIRQPVRLATTENSYTKEQVDTKVASKQDTLVSGTNIKTINSTTVLGNGNFALADQSLSNLDSNGQMVVDSVNGTISNCVLEIPQNIKLELNNNVLTLKAGSVITLAQSTYATITTTVDKTYDVSSSSNSTYFLFIDSSGMYLSLFAVATAVSGATDSLAGTTYHTWFDTTNKVINRYTSDASTPSSTLAYPLCVIIKDSNGVRFAKDSNGNDMIFNSACFIGHHAVVYPNVKGLIANGFNVDGTLKSTDTTLNSLQIRSLTASRTNATVCLGLNTINAHRVYTIVDDVSEITTDDYNIWYVRNENQMYLAQNSQIDILNETMLITYSMDSSYNVTDFTIRQPVRTATVEMVDKKQADLTTVSGYDATATQVLKNINGVLTWVTEV